ncbi:MAG: hypothetical protein K0R59_106 [Sphingobacterium sp.]|jgi:hypothetical protein|nr:hypothetical protein [Sphingobacterium sp.]
MATKTNNVYGLLKVVSWIIFLALCVQAGVFIFNYVFSLFKPIVTQDLYLGLNLSKLYESSRTDYSILFLLLIVTSAFKAYLFYWVVNLFSKLNFVRPFSTEIAKQIVRIGYVALIIGLLSLLALQYALQLESLGNELSFITKYWNDYAGFLMMAVIVFVIVQIFKKGIELQNENDLTL